MSRLILAEDSALLRDGLVEILTRHGHTVLAAVADAPALLDAARRHRPDVVVTDVRMPPGQTDEGLRAARELRAERDDIAVLLLSQYVAPPYLDQLLAQPHRGGLGYLLKDRVADVAEFLDSIDRIAAGHTVIDPDVIRSVLAGRAARDVLARLTDRERDVLELMARGHTNAEIARILVLSESAVIKHVGGVFLRLGLHPDTGNRRVLAVLTYLRHRR